MKPALSVLSILMLCSCAGMAPVQGSLQSSVNGNRYVSGPTSADDPRLRSPQFYMNDDASPMDRSAPPAPMALPFGAANGSCAANCQAHRFSAGYCAQVCGM